MGQPNGRGGVLMPPEYERMEMLLYEIVALGKVKRAGSGWYEVESQTRELGIMIHDGVYDGFMWFERRAQSQEKGGALPNVVP